MAQALVLVQRGHARRLDRGDVDEAVRAAVFGGDEAIALVRIEKFDCADRHGCFLSRNGFAPTAAEVRREVVRQVVNRKEVVVGLGRARAR
jgi:hypothetical protein